jgi:hypothetical protein
MGGSNSKVTQLNESITNVTSAVVAKTSTTANGSIIQNQTISFSGSGNNISILQDAKISLKVLAQADVNSSMQSEIVSAIIAEVSQKKNDFPDISSSKSDTEITNIVRNNVESSFSQESIASLSLAIENSQEVSFAEGSEYSDLLVSQSAQGMGELINNMSGSIVQQLVAGTDLAADTEQTRTSTLADVTDSVGTAAAGVIGAVGDILGIDTSTMLVIAFSFLLLFIYFVMTRRKAVPLLPMTRPLPVVQTPNLYGQ